MKVQKMGARQAMIGITESIAALRIHRTGPKTAEAVLESKALQRVLLLLRKAISPIFSVQKCELFECDDARTLPPLAHYTDIHIDTYDGSVAVPENVVNAARPKPGEAISVISIARSVIGYVRAAFKDTYAPGSEVFVNVRAGEVYLFDLNVSNDYKGVGFSRYLIVSAARAFHERGFSKVIVGRTVQHGVSAGINLERLGFISSLVISAYRILGVRVNVISRKQ